MTFEIGDNVFELANGVILGEQWTVTHVEGDQIQISRIEDGASKTISSSDLVKDPYLAELEQERYKADLVAGLEDTLIQEGDVYDKKEAEEKLAADEEVLKEIDQEIQAEEERKTHLGNVLPLVLAGIFMVTIISK